LRQAEKDLGGDGLKDALKIGGGKREYRLPRWFVGAERGTRGIIGDLLQKRRADLVTQSTPIEC